MISKCKQCGAYWDYYQLLSGECSICQEKFNLIDLKSKFEPSQGEDDGKV